MKKIKSFFISSGLCFVLAFNNALAASESREDIIKYIKKTLFEDRGAVIILFVGAVVVLAYFLLLLRKKQEEENT